MNRTPGEGIRCTVAGDEMLAQELGGGPAICFAIERAAGPVLQRSGIPPSEVTVSVRVATPYAITATVSVQGKAFPEQRIDISDRPLNQRSIDMLGQAVASQLSKANPDLGRPE